MYYHLHSYLISWTQFFFKVWVRVEMKIGASGSNGTWHIVEVNQSPDSVIIFDMKYVNVGYPETRLYMPSRNHV